MGQDVLNRNTVRRRKCRRVGNEMYNQVDRGGDNSDKPVTLKDGQKNALSKRCRYHESHLVVKHGEEDVDG